MTGHRMKRNEPSGRERLFPGPTWEDFNWERRICWHFENCTSGCAKRNSAEESSRVRGRWVHVVWMGQETQMYSSGMNSTPGMAPLSPGLSGSPPLGSRSPKKTTFQSLGSLSSGMFSPSLARGSSHEAKHASNPLNSPTPSIMSSPKLWQKASISRLAEEFFWIGGSVVAQPKWRLGQIGKTQSRLIQYFCLQSVKLLQNVNRLVNWKIYNLLNC